MTFYGLNYRDLAAKFILSFSFGLRIWNLMVFRFLVKLFSSKCKNFLLQKGSKGKFCNRIKSVSDKKNCGLHAKYTKFWLFFSVAEPLAVTKSTTREKQRTKFSFLLFVLLLRQRRNFWISFTLNSKWLQHSSLDVNQTHREQVYFEMRNFRRRLGFFLTVKFKFSFLHKNTS